MIETKNAKEESHDVDGRKHRDYPVNTLLTPQL